MRFGCEVVPGNEGVGCWALVMASCEAVKALVGCVSVSGGSRSGLLGGGAWSGCAVADWKGRAVCKAVRLRPARAPRLDGAVSKN